jgi:hypothetical protein
VYLATWENTWETTVIHLASTEQDAWHKLAWEAFEDIESAAMDDDQIRAVEQEMAKAYLAGDYRRVAELGSEALANKMDVFSINLADKLKPAAKLKLDELDGGEDEGAAKLVVDATACYLSPLPEEAFVP